MTWNPRDKRLTFGEHLREQRLAAITQPRRDTDFTDSETIRRRS